MTDPEKNGLLELATLTAINISVLRSQSWTSLDIAAIRNNVQCFSEFAHSFNIESIDPELRTEALDLIARCRDLSMFLVPALTALAMLNRVALVQFVAQHHFDTIAVHYARLWRSCNRLISISYPALIGWLDGALECSYE